MLSALLSLWLCGAVAAASDLDAARAAYAAGDYATAARLYAPLLSTSPQVRIEAAWTALQQADAEGALALLPPLDAPPRRRAAPPPAEAYVVAAIAEVALCRLGAADRHAERARLRLTSELDHLPPGTTSDRLELLLDLNERAQLAALLQQDGCTAPPRSAEDRLADLYRARSLLEAWLARTAADDLEWLALLLRLAELDLEVGRTHYLREMLIASQAFDDCFEIPGCDLDGISMAHPVADTWIATALADFEVVWQAAPDSPEGITALFLAGQAALMYGPTGQGLQWLEAYVQRAPSGPWAGDAHILLGDEAFNQNNVSRAIQHYRKALALPLPPELEGYARYKMAWGLYNLGELEAAVESMAHILRLELPSPPDLKAEALRDTVFFLASAGQITAAIQFIEAELADDPAEERRLMHRLAAILEDQWRFEEAILVYTHLFSRAPEGDQAPEYLLEIAACQARLGQIEAAQETLARVVRGYGAGTPWAAAHPEESAEAARRAERLLARLPAAQGSE